MFVTGAMYSCIFVFSYMLPQSCACFFQMPGLLSVNSVLLNFPNVWPYNILKFSQSEIGVQLMMANKLVKKAKTSLFFMIANGP